jgi:hypothetical protein
LRLPIWIGAGAWFFVRRGWGVRLWEFMVCRTSWRIVFWAGIPSPS